VVAGYYRGGTELFQSSSSLGASHDRCHLCSAEARELDGEATHAARRAGDEHPAAEDVRPQAEDSERCQARDRQGGRLGE